MKFRDRLAEMVSEGASLDDVAWKLRKPIMDVEAEWKAIVKSLGRQARR